MIFLYILGYFYRHKQSSYAALYLNIMCCKYDFRIQVIHCRLMQSPFKHCLLLTLPGIIGDWPTLSGQIPNNKNLVGEFSDDAKPNR